MRMVALSTMHAALALTWMPNPLTMLTGFEFDQEKNNSDPAPPLLSLAYGTDAVDGSRDAAFKSCWHAKRASSAGSLVALPLLPTQELPTQNEPISATTQVTTCPVLMGGALGFSSPGSLRDLAKSSAASCESNSMLPTFHLPFCCLSAFTFSPLCSRFRNLADFLAFEHPPFRVCHKKPPQLAVWGGARLTSRAGQSPFPSCRQTEGGCC